MGISLKWLSCFWKNIKAHWRKESGNITPNYTSRGLLPAASQTAVLLIKSQVDMKVKYRNLLLPLRGEASPGKDEEQRRKKRGEGRVNLTVSVQRAFSADRSHLARVKGRD